MAWNEPGSGNNNDKDPWTGKPKRNSPPDLEQAIRNMRKKLKQMFTGNNSSQQPSGPSDNPPFKVNGMGVGIILGVLLALWVLWGIFIVDPAEQAVIVRFGKYVGSVGPGPHWIPRIIDNVYTINEQKISNYTYAAEMLTQDQNLVAVSVAVQYRVGNAQAYLFNVVDPVESLKQATASALRQVIGHTNLDVVLTSGREQIRQQVQDLLTKILARYNTGLLITDVALLPAKAPEEVKDAFDDAIRAQEDEQRFVNQAQSYAMQVEPNAKGQAQRLLADAKGYQQQTILRAQADTAQFLALLPKYQSAPAVTRERMYLDAIESVLSNSNKVLIDTNSNNMFYLPIDKLLQNSAKTPAAFPAPAAIPAPAAPAPAVPFTSPVINNNDTNNMGINTDAANLGRLQGGYSQ